MKSKWVPLAARCSCIGVIKPFDGEIRAITDSFECYGYRRVGAVLHHRDYVVHATNVCRLMRKYDLKVLDTRRASQPLEVEPENLEQ